MLSVGLAANPSPAAFTATTGNGSSSFSAAGFFPLPATLALGATTAGAEPDRIRPGEGYRIYADFTIGGAPTGGVDTADTDVSGITAGTTAGPLSWGLETFNATSYWWSTGTLTADTALTQCAYDYTVTARNSGGPTRTSTGTAVVDRVFDDAFVTLLGPSGSALGNGAAAAGDVNGDGRDDLLIAAPGATASGGKTNQGIVYVVFGRATSATIDLDTAGSWGYEIRGATSWARLGRQTANLGDVNGDGRPDAVLGAHTDKRADNGDNTGVAWVVFGKTDTSAIELDSLGAGGYDIRGEAVGDNAGHVVGVAGDINGDGKPDAIIGATGADPLGRNGAGAAYVVYSKATTSSLDLGSLGGNGFRIAGATVDDGGPEGVGGLGDINDDGYDDVGYGADGYDYGGTTDLGAAWVVLGQASPSDVDLANLGTGGFRLLGENADSSPGRAFAALGDLNGDGRDDFALGADRTTDLGRTDAGAAYVIYGRTSTTNLDLASLGSDGYRILGADTWRTGISVAPAGDRNGDGLTDLFTGSQNADPGGRNNAGAASVVFSMSSPADVDFDTLGTGGYHLEGIDAGDAAGRTIAIIGDFAGDGGTYALVGAAGASPGGKAFVIRLPDSCSL